MAATEAESPARSAAATVEPGKRRTAKPATALIVLGVGVLAYVLTVMQRTTLGVAGLDAAERFGVSPGTLSMFVFIQVAVYVSAQIPAGLLVDRFGSRLMLVVSGLLLVAGQVRAGVRHRDSGGHRCQGPGRYG